MHAVCMNGCCQLSCGFLEIYFFGFPTRVVVMSVLIITLRIFHNINGYGTWEESLSNVANKQGALEDVTMESTMSFEFDARELLRVLKAVHKDIEVKHDYPKDLNSYLKYFKDVISAEMTADSNLRVNRTIDKCWNIYNKNEDNDSGIKPDNLNFEQKDIGGSRYSDDVTISTSFESDTHLSPDNYDKRCSSHKCVVDSSSREERELDRMRFEMEQNWFCYLAPVSKRKSKGTNNIKVKFILLNLYSFITYDTQYAVKAGCESPCGAGALLHKAKGTKFFGFLYPFGFGSCTYLVVADAQELDLNFINICWRQPPLTVDTSQTQFCHCKPCDMVCINLHF